MDESSRDEDAGAEVAGKEEEAMRDWDGEIGKSFDEDWKRAC